MEKKHGRAAGRRGREETARGSWTDTEAGRQQKNRHALEGREGRGMYTYSLKLHGLVRSWAGLVVVVVLLSLPFSEGGSFLSLLSPQ